jgi:hypothetical protein
MPPQEKGTITVTDDDLVQSTPITTESTPVALPPAGPTWWDRVNKGTVSPDRFLSWATGGQMKSVADLEKEKDTTPRKGETPGQAFSRVFHSGFAADLAKTASAASSPAAIAAAGISQTAKIPGLIGKVSRAGLTGLGLGYGAMGAGEAMEGASEGYKTPEGSQKILSGLSQVAAAAPAAAQAYRGGKGLINAIAPQFFARGESAFVAALAPAPKMTPKLRDAYRVVGNDLRTAPVKDLPALEEYASMKRHNAAQELNTELSRINPQATLIDRFAATDAIRNRVDWTIKTSSPKEAQVILDYAQRIQDEMFKNPVDLAKAETIVQGLNRKSVKFDNLPERDQIFRLANGDPILGEKALKMALQDQIEAKLTGYRDLKRQYGAWKEIQDQTQARVDKLEAKGGNVEFWRRKAIEALFGAGGAGLGFMHGGAEGIAGGAIGYLLSKVAADAFIEKMSRPENVLQRGLQAPAGPPRKLPFLGQVAQPVAASQGDDTDKILDQMFGASGGR